MVKNAWMRIHRDLAGSKALIWLSPPGSEGGEPGYQGVRQGIFRGRDMALDQRFIPQDPLDASAEACHQAAVTR
jgi:hypothetical protein